MQITNLRLDALPAVNLDLPQVQAERTRGDFDRALHDANRRQTGTEPAAPREGEQASRTESPEPQEIQATQEATPVDEYVPAEAADYQQPETLYITDQEAAIYITALQYVAETTGLSAEAIKEWLIKENVDLHELPEPVNLPKFVEYTLGKKAPAELLTDPVVPEVQKALHEAAELLKVPKDTAVHKEVVVAAAETTVKTTPLVQANIEGLEVLEEDGEVIITEKRAETAPQGENSNSSSSNQNSSSQQTEAGPLFTQVFQPVNSAAVDLQPQAAAVETTYQAQIQQVADAARPAPTQPAVNAQDVINQIMSQVKVASSGQTFTEMRMTLRPESLGDIVLRVITQNGIVMAQFEAESQRIKETLEANFNQLRDALTEAGISFGALDVYVRQEGQEPLSQFERERQAARKRMESILAEEEVDLNKDPLHNGLLDEVA